MFADACVNSELCASKELLAEATSRPSILRLIRIHSSKSKPDNSFVNVSYRNTYFWIDDSDLLSKQMFSLMMMFFTLADTGERENLPLVTIPSR